MSGDLVGGGYPVIDPFTALGLPSNVAQGNIAARSNLHYGILGSLQDAAASLVSGDLTYVPVPVCVGDLIQTVTVLVGATGASTPTHQFAALYSGVLTTAKILGSQSTDGTTTAIPASTALAFTLGSKYIIQPADAPNGYILVGLSVTASTVPSLVSGTVPTATQKTWFTNTPLLGATYSSALGATAPTSITLASASALASPPVVILT
jgi:hypothetical protein